MNSPYFTCRTALPAALPPAALPKIYSEQVSGWWLDARCRMKWGSDVPVLGYKAPHEPGTALQLFGQDLRLTPTDKTDLLDGTAERVLF